MREENGKACDVSQTNGCKNVALTGANARFQAGEPLSAARSDQPRLVLPAEIHRPRVPAAPTPLGAGGGSIARTASGAMGMEFLVRLLVFRLMAERRAAALGPEAEEGHRGRIPGRGARRGGCIPAAFVAATIPDRKR